MDERSMLFIVRVRKSLPLAPGLVPPVTTMLTLPDAVLDAFWFSGIGTTMSAVLIAAVVGINVQTFIIGIIVTKVSPRINVVVEWLKVRPADIRIPTPLLPSRSLLAKDGHVRLLPILSVSTELPALTTPAG